MELKIVPQNEAETSVSLGDAVKERKVPTEAQKREAVAAIKATKRNDLCPCGCGKKVKRCVNGRRVLEFKKMFRGFVLGELMFVLIFLLIFVLVMFNLRDQYFTCKYMGKKPVTTAFGYTCVDSTAAQTLP